MFPGVLAATALIAVNGSTTTFRRADGKIITKAGSGYLDGTSVYQTPVIVGSTGAHCLHLIDNVNISRTRLAQAVTAGTCDCVEIITCGIADRQQDKLLRIQH